MIEANTAKTTGLTEVDTAKTTGLTEVTDLNLEEEVLDAEGLIVVDFWGPSCAPCKVLLPILEELKVEHPEVKFCKVNAEVHNGLSREFSVKGLPTLVYFKDGKVIDTTVGVLPKKALLKKIIDLL